MKVWDDVIVFGKSNLQSWEILHIHKDINMWVSVLINDDVKRVWYHHLFYTLKELWEKMKIPKELLWF